MRARNCDSFQTPSPLTGEGGDGGETVPIHSAPASRTPSPPTTPIPANAGIQSATPLPTSIPRNRPIRLYAGLALLLIALGVIAAATAVRVKNDAPTLPPLFDVNRIAVVAPDAKIRLYAPDGSDGTLVSPDDEYSAWPTWAPDGGGMVFSGVARDADDRPVVTLYEYDLSERVPRPIHEGEPGFGGLLADGVLHYPLWSPDSAKLAFVAVTQAHGLTLFVKRMDAPEPPQYVLDQGPLWTSWSSDSTTLAIHRSDDHFLLDAQGDLELSRVSLESASYRVPAWRPGRAELALSRLVQQSRSAPRNALYSAPITDTGLALNAPIAEVGAYSAFLWSPDGAYLAVADDARAVRYMNAPMFAYRTLRVLDSRSGFSETARVLENVLAYFWSPDGSRIAVAAVADASGDMRWLLLDPATGETTELVDFVPSRDQLTMFQFFDQYAYSHSLWSPDSRYLLFAGRLSFRASSAGYSSQSSQSRVFIIDAGETRAVDALADGGLGVWSPL